MNTTTTRTVTIGRGVAVHAAAKYGTVCADFVRPGHAAARRNDAEGPITCKTCRKILGLPVEAPKAAPKAAPVATVSLTSTPEWKKYRAGLDEVSRLLRAGEREEAIALSESLEAMKTW